MLEELRYFALAELTYKKALRIDPENQNVKDHYQFFLKTYVNGNEYLQACRVYIPGYANIQEKPAFNEEENLEKALELFEKSSFYRK
jgi:transcriptional regulator of heat shock response